MSEVTVNSTLQASASTESPTIFNSWTHIIILILLIIVTVIFFWFVRFSMNFVNSQDESEEISKSVSDEISASKRKRKPLTKAEYEKAKLDLPPPTNPDEGPSRMARLAVNQQKNRLSSTTFESTSTLRMSMDRYETWNGQRRLFE